MKCIVSQCVSQTVIELQVTDRQIEEPPALAFSSPSSSLVDENERGSFPPRRCATMLASERRQQLIVTLARDRECM
jgi:hypothetical protein